jgi:hypothetical protein
MKKVLFTLIAAIAFCGSIFAQAYETHYPFYSPAYEQHGSIVAVVEIDNNIIAGTDNYEAFEIGAFVNGTTRGNAFMVFQPEYGDPYPVVMLEIFYDPTGADTGKEIDFKLYNHETEEEFDYFTTSVELLTGDDNLDYNNPMTISFFHTFTKEISPYTSITDGDGWYFITSPLNEEVNPENVLNMTSNDYDLYSFEQTAELEWLNFEFGAFENLVAGKGYLYANGGESGQPVTLTFIGAPYDGDGQVQLDYSNTNADHSMWGWNLVGNPFYQTAFVDCDEYYRMNEFGTEVIPGEGNEIGALEGIFVQAQGEGESVTFSPARRNVQEQIILNVTNNDNDNAIDRAIVRFGQGRMLPKFMLNENHTKMYISKDDNDYAVVRSKKSGRLPVSFQPAENGTYKINVNAENLNMKYLHLVDNLTGADIDLLRTPSYSFDASTTDSADRFILVFKVAVTPIHPLVLSDVKNIGFFSNGEWIINNEGDALLQVIDVNGQILINEEINGSVSKHINAAPGVYILRLVNGKDEKTQKIVIE